MINPTKPTLITLEPYDYVGGPQDGEWGVHCYIDKEYFCSGMDVAQVLERVLEEKFNCVVCDNAFS